MDQKLLSTQSQRHDGKKTVKLSELLEIDENILISVSFVHDFFELYDGIVRAHGFKNI